MKKTFVFTFCLCAFLARLSAQNVGIGTNNPFTKLEVKGGFSVKSDYVHAVAGPTPAQTFTMVNANTVTMPETDSVGRIYDPGGASGNYNANLAAYAYVQDQPFFGSYLELTIESINLGTGDSLILYDGFGPSGTALYQFGNGYTTTNLTLTFSNNRCYCVFKSNADAVVGTGFSLFFKRKYMAPFLNDPRPTGGAGITFFPRRGAFSAGQLSASTPGSNSIALGYQSRALATNSVAIGTETEASGQGAVAIGYRARATGTGIAIGNAAVATADPSFAIGASVNASGYASVAMGNNSRAQGTASMATGEVTIASGIASTAMGSGSWAAGFASTAMGLNTYVKSIGALAIGRYNDTLTTENPLVWAATDRAFVIGDGTAFNARSSCFYILKNGNGWMQGTLTQASDARLKTNIIQLSNVLPKLLRLNGYNYYWKDKENMPGLQAGLIAQEVQEEMPELVTTNTEGQLAVNYSGMVPYLLEGLKEQEKKINVQEKELRLLKEEIRILKVLVSKKLQP